MSDNRLAEPNLDYCRGHEGGFTVGDHGRTDVFRERTAWRCFNCGFVFEGSDPSEFQRHNCESRREATAHDPVSKLATKHDDGKPRADLLPPDALLEVSKVLDYGAKKYTQYGECTCGAGTATKRASMPRAGAGVATRSGSETSTPPMPNGNASALPTGFNESRNTRPPSTERQASEGVRQPTDFRLTDTERSSLEAANSAESEPGFASTTTTPPEQFVGVSASPATSASGGWKSAAGSSEHSPTCGARRVLRSGERNWEKGLAWGRLSGALLRHLWAWMRGEERDPESGLPHLAHMACCALMLLASTLRKVGIDDRSGAALEGKP